MIVTRVITLGRRSDRTRKLVAHAGDRPTPPPAGRVPRVARLMALAIHLDGELRRGAFATQQTLADALHITQPRLTQILNLNHLAPDIQQALLDLPRTEHGRDPITERDLRPIAAIVDWSTQRRVWRTRVLEATSLTGPS
ncbi:MAG: hypothetical protein AB7Q17_12435 [Phycisphaerae bacterium]